MVGFLFNFFYYTDLEIFDVGPEFAVGVRLGRD
jgi:hypothetical protein